MDGSQLIATVNGRDPNAKPEVARYWGQGLNSDYWHRMQAASAANQAWIAPLRDWYRD